MIPTKTHKEILSKLHEAHPGAEQTKQQAQLIVYWPGLLNDIDNVASSCRLCQHHTLRI